MSGEREHDHPSGHFTISFQHHVHSYDVGRELPSIVYVVGAMWPLPLMMIVTVSQGAEAYVRACQFLI